MSTCTSAEGVESILTTPIAEYEYISSEESAMNINAPIADGNVIVSSLGGKIQHFIPPSQLLSIPFLAKMHSQQTYKYPFFQYSNQMQGSQESLTAVLGIMQSTWSGNDEDTQGLIEYAGLKRGKCSSSDARPFVQCPANKWVYNTTPTFDTRPVIHFSFYRYMLWFLRSADVRYKFLQSFTSLMDGMDTLTELQSKGDKFIQQEYQGYSSIKKLHMYCSDLQHNLASEGLSEDEQPSLEVLANLEMSEMYIEAVQNTVISFLASEEGVNAQMALIRPYSSNVQVGEVVLDVPGSEQQLLLGKLQYKEDANTWQKSQLGYLGTLFTLPLSEKQERLRNIFLSAAVSECGVYDCVDTEYGVHSTQWIGDVCHSLNLFCLEVSKEYNLEYTPIDSVLFHTSIFRVVVLSIITCTYSALENGQPCIPGGLLLLLTDQDHEETVMLTQKHVDVTGALLLLLTTQLRNVRRACYLYHRPDPREYTSQGCPYIKADATEIYAPIQVVTIGSFLLTDCPDLMCQLQFLLPSLVSDSYKYDTVLDIYLKNLDKVSRQTFLKSLLDIPIQPTEQQNDKNPSMQDFVLPAITPQHDLMTSLSALHPLNIAVTIGPLSASYYHGDTSLDALLRDTAFASLRKGSFLQQTLLQTNTCKSNELIDLRELRVDKTYTVGNHTFSSFYTQPIRPQPVLTPTCLSQSQEIALLSYWYNGASHEEQLQVSTYQSGLAHAYYPQFLSPSLVPSDLTAFVKEAYDKANYCVQAVYKKLSSRTMDCLMDYGNHNLWKYKHATAPEPQAKQPEVDVASNISLTTFGSPRAQKPVDQRRRTPSKARRSVLSESPRRGLMSSNNSYNNNMICNNNITSFVLDEQYISHALLYHPASIHPSTYYYVMQANLNNNTPSTTDEVYYQDVTDTLLYNPYKLYHEEQPHMYPLRHMYPRVLPLLTKVQQKLRSTGLVFAPSDILYDTLLLLPTKLQTQQDTTNIYMNTTTTTTTHTSDDGELFRSLDMSMNMDISTEEIEHDHTTGNIFKTANQLQIMLGTPIQPHIARHRTQRPRFTHLKEEENYMYQIMGSGGQGKHRTDDFKFVACSSIVQDVLTEMLFQQEREREAELDNRPADNYDYIYQETQ